jgi:hypothetical protein
MGSENRPFQRDARPQQSAGFEIRFRCETNHLPDCAALC